MKKKSGQHFAISPYLHQLLLFGMGGLFLCAILTIYFLGIQSNDSVYKFLPIVLCPLLIFLVVCICNSYEYFGKIQIEDSQIICRALFKKSLCFKYSEIQEIGMDYTLLSGKKQYWIYLNREKAIHAYLHRVNRMPINQNRLRIQFTDEVFYALMQHLPNDLKKTLNRSKPCDTNHS